MTANALTKIVSLPMTQNSPPVFALEFTVSPDTAFDLADSLGMEGELTALGVSIFDAPDGQMLVQAIYPSQVDAVMAMQSLLPTNQAGASIEGTVYQLPDTDWVSETQAGLPPVRAGRFFVHGSHDAEAVPANVTAIHVDAGLAFGTGHHGTTAGCLRIYDDLLAGGYAPQSVLDLGCGAGVLAIAAAKTLPAETYILATDIDPDAIDVTRDNATQNAVALRIDAAVADGFSHDKLAGQSFDLIFANILAGPLMGLSPEIATASASGGRVILSGILDEKAAEVTSCFEGVGFTVTPQPSLEGWTSLLAVKPT